MSPTPLLLIDAHEDIAWNVQTFGRDYTKSALWNRQREAGTQVPEYTGHTLLGKPEWLLGHVGLIFATTFVAPARRSLGAWDTQAYQTQQEAYDNASRQLDVYYRMADEDEVFQVVVDQAGLQDVLATWENGVELADRRVGLVPLMEGADPILEPEQAEEWFERGIRIIGLAWVSTRYAGGTHEPGGLTADGMELLEVMAGLGMILDLSHLAEQAYHEAVDRYEGVIIASHANPRRFVDTPRMLSDDQIRMLAERGGVMGIVPYNCFLDPDWRWEDRKDAVSISLVADAIDHVCQVTGSAAHVGIGSDFDGGFGWEHAPGEIDSVADLPLLREPLLERGYTGEQITGFFSGNWLRMLEMGLPE